MPRSLGEMLLCNLPGNMRSGADLKNVQELAASIVGASDEMRSFPDRKLLKWSNKLQQLSYGSNNLGNLLPLAYSMVREAARRVHGLSHYEVQLIAGIELFNGGVVEMQTGEGKTMVALLPTFLFALNGQGCHVVTANDYLARRDAKFAGDVFSLLGITAGCIFDGLPRSQRKQPYMCSVTYGTAREFGFDFLKDKIALRGQTSNCTGSELTLAVQRGHHFALVDEADSVLIDDARTPLVIASPDENDCQQNTNTRKCHKIATQLSGEAFRIDNDQRLCRLTRGGCRQTLQLSDQQLVYSAGADWIYRQVENALSAIHLFRVNQHYIVDQGEVSIVDESTGRVSEGRKWQRGLHQAIEAKEGLEVTASTNTQASITIQSYFRRYQRLAGLTGTARDAAREFKKVFGLKIKAIPTRLPSMRVGLPVRIFSKFDDKAQAIANETIHRLHAGQAVLIGTSTVAASQNISKKLNQFSIQHRVLNCLEHDQEAEIIEKAGQVGRVTVATNMAGRGTDIRVDEQVLNNGGLHIIATAKHSSQRIDRQLIGRTARQGQPGSWQLFLSLEDELLGLAGVSVPHLANRNGRELGVNHLRLFKQAQAKLERLYQKQRLELLKQENQRAKVCLQMGVDPCLEFLNHGP